MDALGDTPFHSQEEPINSRLSKAHDDSDDRMLELSSELLSPSSSSGSELALSESMRLLHLDSPSRTPKVERKKDEDAAELTQLVAEQRWREISTHIEVSGDPNCKLEGGGSFISGNPTLLEAACDAKKYDTALQLVRLGANPLRSSRHKASPVHRLIANNFTDLAKAMLEASAKEFFGGQFENPLNEINAARLQAVFTATEHSVEAWLPKLLRTSDTGRQVLDRATINRDLIHQNLPTLDRESCFRISSFIEIFGNHLPEDKYFRAAEDCSGLLPAGVGVRKSGPKVSVFPKGKPLGTGASKTARTAFSYALAPRTVAIKMRVDVRPARKSAGSYHSISQESAVVQEMRRHGIYQAPGIAQYYDTYSVGYTKALPTRRGVQNLEKLGFEMRFYNSPCRLENRDERNLGTTLLLLGLSRLHEADIVHGDIKPPNILISRHAKARTLERVDLADFDSSATLKKVRASEVPLLRGTPGFLSPEWGDQGISKKGDVYALGITLFLLETSSRNPKLIMQLTAPETREQTLKMVPDPITRRLIASMTYDDPKERPSAQKCLASWLRAQRSNIKLIRGIKSITLGQLDGASKSHRLIRLTSQPLRAPSSSRAVGDR